MRSVTVRWPGPRRRRVRLQSKRCTTLQPSASSALSLRQFCQQATVARFHVAHVEALVDLPSLTEGGVHHRNAEVLLQQFDHAHGLPAATLYIDAISVAVFAIELLQMSVETLNRNLRDLIERHVDRLHRQSPEARGDHV